MQFTSLLSFLTQRAVSGLKRFFKELSSVLYQFQTIMYSLKIGSKSLQSKLQKPFLKFFEF